MLNLFKRKNQSSENTGFYDNIPNRVGKWVIVKNTQDEISFMTTDPEICDGETETRIKIQRKDKEGWMISIHEAGIVSVLLNTVEEIENMERSRKRALWHAKKYMEGVSMTNKERYTDTYTIMNKRPESLYTVDPYFHAKSEMQENPFEDYLKH